MPLYLKRDGYTFRADMLSLTIDPGTEPIALTRSELEQIGLAIRNDYHVPSREEKDAHTIAAILATLSEALRRFEGASQVRARRDLRRAMVLIDRLDEATAREIIGQEGV